jgi:O-antigen ligase
MSLERAGIGSIIGNANDYSGYLLFLLPFLLWVVMKSRSFIVRILGVGAVGYGLYMILLSGSRGAALALAVDGLFVLLTVSLKKKLMLLALIPVIIMGSISFIPSETLQRITTFSSNPDSDNEAVQSQEARTQLFFDAVMCAVTHPILGVGPGQFVNYEGPTAKNWHNAHNSYAEAASECGFPGLIFYLLALFLTVRLLRKSRAAARSLEDGGEIDKAAFCMQLALVGYCTAIIFLNFTYFFLLPMMSGICIGMMGATETLPRHETVVENEGVSLEAHGF